MVVQPHRRVVTALRRVEADPPAQLASTRLPPACRPRRPAGEGKMKRSLNRLVVRAAPAAVRHRLDAAKGTATCIAERHATGKQRPSSSHMPLFSQVDESVNDDNSVIVLSPARVSAQRPRC